MTCAEKLQQIDDKLWQQLHATHLSVETVQQLLRPQQQKSDALRHLLREAQKELSTLQNVPACQDLLLHFATEMDSLRDILSTLHTHLVELQRFAASSYYDAHASMMPHLSQEEIQCINDNNQLLPCASTADMP